MRAICGVLLKDRKRDKELMLMFGLNETMDQLTMASSVCSYGRELRMENGHISKGH